MPSMPSSEKLVNLGFSPTSLCLYWYVLEFEGYKMAMSLNQNILKSVDVRIRAVPNSEINKLRDISSRKHLSDFRILPSVVAKYSG